MAAYDRIVGLLLTDIAIDGCISKAPGGGEVAGPSPVYRRKQGRKRSLLIDWYGIPLGRVLTCANAGASLDDLGPMPGDITVHLDAGHDSGKTRALLLRERELASKIARKGQKARSKPPNGGASNGPTPGTTPSPGWSAATNAPKSSSRPCSTSPTPSSPSEA